ncbi:MAG: sulfotransferase [Acidimicrobiia bacterium]|nr:sulfotransferase [Acidimicrobiia bacterium]
MVLGMHRSGTSMLANLLADAGLFLGHKTQPGHQEAEFFQRLNIYVLQEGSAAWDRPDGVDDLLADQRTRDYLIDYMKTSVDSPRAVNFLGPSRWLRTRSLTGFTDPWGWKDPRTTLLWPLWLEVFPQAKVIHVTRHGVDVARSLQVRTDASIDEYVDAYQRRRQLYRLVGRRRRFEPSLRVADIDAGLALWEVYVAAAHEAVEALGERAVEFRYEDFLADPDPIMHRLLDFCELEPTPDRSWADEVLGSRAFAHRGDAGLVAVAERHRDRLARHGYNDA